MRSSSTIQKDKQKLPERIILGIDPGTNILGFSILKVKGSDIELEEIDIIRMEKEKDHYQKLKKIFSGVKNIISSFHPDEMAIESPFFGKNIQSMLKLGRAQGVAITAALAAEIPVFEYSPRKIKQSITGNGNASKEQVAAILSQLLKFDSKHLLMDATDSLGVAVCHYFQRSMMIKNGKKVKGWKQFIEQNPGRLAAVKKLTNPTIAQDEI